MLSARSVTDRVLAELVYSLSDRAYKFNGPVEAGYGFYYKEVHPGDRTLVMVFPGAYSSKWFSLGGTCRLLDYSGKILVIGPDRDDVSIASDIIGETVRRMQDKSDWKRPVQVELSDIDRADSWGSHVFIAVPSQYPVERGMVDWQDETFFNAGCTSGFCVFTDAPVKVVLAEPIRADDLEEKTKMYAGFEITYRVRVIV